MRKLTDITEHGIGKITPKHFTSGSIHVEIEGKVAVNFQTLFENERGIVAINQSEKLEYQLLIKMEDQITSAFTGLQSFKPVERLLRQLFFNPMIDLISFHQLEQALDEPRSHEIENLYMSVCSAKSKAMDLTDRIERFDPHYVPTYLVEEQNEYEEKLAKTTSLVSKKRFSNKLNKIQMDINQYLKEKQQSHEEDVETLKKLSEDPAFLDAQSFLEALKQKIEIEIYEKNILQISLKQED